MPTEIKLDGGKTSRSANHCVVVVERNSPSELYTVVYYCQDIYHILWVTSTGPTTGCGGGGGRIAERGVRNAEYSQAGWFVRGSRWDGSLRESLEACGRSRRCGVRFGASCRPRLRATWATPSAVKCGTRGRSSGTPARVRMGIWHSEPEICDLRLRYGTRPGCCHGIR